MTAPGTLDRALLGFALSAIGMASGAVSTSSVAQPAERVFELHIEQGEVAPDKRRLRVSEGDTVRLLWTADAPMVVHLHGYDIEKKVVPGRIAEMRVEARATGRFPVELHVHRSSSGHDAPLLVLEVYPR